MHPIYVFIYFYLHSVDPNMVRRTYVYGNSHEQQNKLQKIHKYIIRNSYIITVTINT
jgi:hypothetical protein